MNESELENLLDAYTETIRSVCRKYFLIGGNEDDLFQEGMIGLIEACRDFDRSKGDYSSLAFKKFAMVCIKRQIIDAIKHANAKKNQGLNNYVSFNQKNSKDEEFNLEFDSSDIANLIIENPEEQILNKETYNEQLAELESKLTEKEKQVLKLYLEGLTQSKIAKTLNKPVKQIDNTIQRIKKKCKNNQKIVQK